MFASSAFVLTALTMTGIYMQAGDEKSQDDGYTLDFTALEDNMESKSKEIALNTPVIEDSELTFDRIVDEGFNPEDDLDYMPLEAGSGNIEIPGLTTVPKEDTIIEEETPDVKEAPNVLEAPNVEEAPKKEEPLIPEEPEVAETPREEISAEQAYTERANTEPIIPEQANVEQAAGEIVEPELHFAAGDGLIRPLEGEVLIPFNMSGSEFFSTLEVYKYNPALMLMAQEGTSVIACAAGRVIDIFQDSEIGQAITMDLGDGYQITYGQLKGINVALNSYVKAGDMIASVAAPTKYYCVEGSNLYLKLTSNGIPVDPETLFR